MEPINLADYEARAGTILSKDAWDYFRSGAHDERTRDWNQSAFAEYEIHPRVLIDVERRDLSTTMFGHPVSTPILVAPMAFQGLACAEGELATVRAAGRAGTIMVLSTLSNTDVEDVVAAASGPVFFQLYVYRDRAATRELVQRAEAAGCSALVLTVDAPLIGTRERDVRNRFHLPNALQIRNMLAKGALPTDVPASGLSAYFASLIDPSLSWSDLAWLASITTLPIIIKGILRPDDAIRAADHGAAGIVVSNHGGRQLDGAPATIDVLASIVEVVGDRLPILMDGGIRRGTDVLTALALGASGVLIGRPVLWGLGVSGEDGAAHVLELLSTELSLAMALSGCVGVSDITPDLVRRRR